MKSTYSCDDCIGRRPVEIRNYTSPHKDSPLYLAHRKNWLLRGVSKTTRFLELDAFIHTHTRDLPKPHRAFIPTRYFLHALDGFPHPERNARLGRDTLSSFHSTLLIHSEMSHAITFHLDYPDLQSLMIKNKEIYFSGS